MKKKIVILTAIQYGPDFNLGQPAVRRSQFSFENRTTEEVLEIGLQAVSTDYKDKVSKTYIKGNEVFIEVDLSKKEFVN